MRWKTFFYCKIVQCAMTKSECDAIVSSWEWTWWFLVLNPLIENTSCRVIGLITRTPRGKHLKALIWGLPCNDLNFLFLRINNCLLLCTTTLQNKPTLGPLLFCVAGGAATLAWNTAGVWYFPSLLPKPTTPKAKHRTSPKPSHLVYSGMDPQTKLGSKKHYPGKRPQTVC